MHFRTIASIALLACASHVAAESERQPYKLASMPIDGLSLARRDTNGYTPEQSHCGAGNTCAEACGEGYTTCPSNDKSTHCFNPAKQQSCCTDGTGNSCDKGYYCTHDTALQTWCCPDEMNLAQCAAKYGVTGLVTNNAPAPTSSATPATPKITSPTTRIMISTTSSSSSTSSTSTFFTPVTPSTSSTHAVTKTKTIKETACASSSGYTTAWTGSNSTISSAVPTQPSEATTISTLIPTVVPTQSTGGANIQGFSAVLLVAAGVLALL